MFSTAISRQIIIVMFIITLHASLSLLLCPFCTLSLSFTLSHLDCGNSELTELAIFARSMIGEIGKSPIILYSTAFIIIGLVLFLFFILILFHCNHPLASQQIFCCFYLSINISFSSCFCFIFSTKYSCLYPLPLSQLMVAVLLILYHRNFTLRQESGKSPYILHSIRWSSKSSVHWAGPELSLYLSCNRFPSSYNAKKSQPIIQAN